MITRVIEIRDEGTRIMALAIKMEAANRLEEQALRCYGYPRDGSAIVLMNLNDQKASSDPYSEVWNGSRTMRAAHAWITEHWDDFREGDVIDCRFIAGTASAPARSEVFV